MDNGLGHHHVNGNSSADNHNKIYYLLSDSIWLDAMDSQTGETTATVDQCSRAKQSNAATVRR
jgi:hypothetical protein